MNKLQLLLATSLGIILGIIGSRFLFVGSAHSLIPWGIVGLILGWISKNNRGSLINGSIYGFFLAFTFMLSGYSGKATIITRIPPFFVLGLFGAICGLILTTIGLYAKTKLKRS